MIISTVRSCSISDSEKYTSNAWLGKRLGFITDPNQVNVAITRAQDGLCILGKQWMMLINWWEICKPKSIVLSFQTNFFGEYFASNVCLCCFRLKHCILFFSFFLFCFFYMWLKCLNIFVACVQVVTVFSMFFTFMRMHKHVYVNILYMLIHSLLLM